MHLLGKRLFAEARIGLDHNKVVRLGFRWSLDHKKALGFCIFLGFASIAIGLRPRDEREHPLLERLHQKRMPA